MFVVHWVELGVIDLVWLVSDRVVFFFGYSVFVHALVCTWIIQDGALVRMIRGVDNYDNFDQL